MNSYASFLRVFLLSICSWLCTINRFYVTLMHFMPWVAWINLANNHKFTSIFRNTSIFHDKYSRERKLRFFGRTHWQKLGSGKHAINHRRTLAIECRIVTREVSGSLRTTASDTRRPLERGRDRPSSIAFVLMKKVNQYWRPDATVNRVTRNSWLDCRAFSLYLELTTIDTLVSKLADWLRRDASFWHRWFLSWRKERNRCVD